MLEKCMRKTLIVGGGIQRMNKSGIVTKLAKHLKGPITICNGVLPNFKLDQDLIIWMPDIDNDQPKDYPKKKQGAVLICSKVMREGYTHIDSVSRIFKMKGNAVIEIYKNDYGIYEFELRDALSNVWCGRTKDLPDLIEGIVNLYNWTKGSIRKSLEKGLFSEPDPDDPEEVERFLRINEELSHKVAVGCGNRYFGNYSTRCTRLFPNMISNENWFLFSGRNTPKDSIKIEDMVSCNEEHYYGYRKPSVDAPVQIEIYKKFPELKYMIHGHAYIVNGEKTKNYFPCGDMREVDEVVELIKQGVRKINLKNHGFLFVGESVDEIISHANDCEFRSL
jgi:ribulose-5-phosphate 4-epimerase/fuculose-1-phosphate aldolase